MLLVPSTFNVVLYTASRDASPSVYIWLVVYTHGYIYTHIQMQLKLDYNIDTDSFWTSLASYVVICCELHW